MSSNTSIKFRVEYLLTLFLSLLTRILPYKLCLIAANILGDIFNYVLRMRREVTLNNLRKSFPEKTDSEIKRICRDAYRTASMTIVDFARLPALSHKKISGLVKIHNIHLLEEAQKEKRARCW